MQAIQADPPSSEVRREAAVSACRVLTVKSQKAGEGTR